MSEMIDDVLPTEPPTGEVVHWMDRGPLRFGPTGIPASAAGGFVLGLAVAVGGYFLWRYLAPRKEALPPWRWGRGPVH